MHFYQKLASNTLYQIIGRVFSSGASFLVTILVARHFGVIAYGDFAKVTAYISIFYLFVDLGLNAIFLQREDAQIRFRDLFYGRLIIALVIVLVSNALGFLLPYNSVANIGFSPMVRVGLGIFSWTILTESILFSAMAVFQRKLIYQKVMGATIIGAVVSVTSAAAFAILNFPLLWIFVALLMGAIAEAGAAIVFTDERLFPVKIDVKFAKHLGVETLPVALMLIFNLIYFRIDTIILSLLKPTLDVALYDIAYRIFDFLLAFPLFLSNVFYIRFITDEKNNRSVKSKLLFYILSFAIIGAFAAIPAWIISPYVFSFIKPELIDAVVPMRILLVSLPIFFATSIFQWIFISQKKQRELAWCYAILVVVNIALNLLFIPTYSYVGSAIITGGSELVMFVIMLGMFLRK